MIESWSDAGSLLAIRLDGMGDLLMTTPALRALKQTSRRLTLLTSHLGRVVADGLPFVDDVMTFAAPWVKSSRPASADDTLGLVAKLRERAFDGAVIFTVYSQSALPAATLVHLAGIPRRVAYCRENPYGLLTQWLPDPDRDPNDGVRHEVQRQLDLVAAIGSHANDARLSYEVSEPARAALRAKAAARGLDAARPWIVVHPGATAPSRRYPIRLLCEALRALAADRRWRVVLAGAAEDAEAIAALREAAPNAVSLAAALDWSELAALLQAARVVVCNNSGPAHLAAAVGTPVVDLYALTNPQHTPWAVGHRSLSHDVPCRWCLKSVCPHGHQRCLAGVAPSEVVRAVDELFDAATQSAPPLPRRSHAPAPFAIPCTR
jgi:lipopolysaccharide heptosyltransferase II